MTLLLIDDAGGCWDGGSGRVKQAFNSPFAGPEFADYVVRNLGFIAVDIFGTSLQVRISQAAATALALQGFQDWLARHRPQRIAISWWERGGWRYELMRHADVTFLIDRLIRAARAGSPNRPFVTSPVKTGPDITDPQALLQAPLLQRPPEALETSQQMALINLIKRAVGDRYVLVEGDPGRQKLVFAEFGAEIYVQQLPWSDRQIGQPIDMQPDPEYGRWIHASYAEVIRSSRPILEDVDAIVNWRDDGRRRLRYRRLLVPFRSAAGRPYVLAGSIKNDGIDLRAGEVGELRKVG